MYYMMIFPLQKAYNDKFWTTYFGFNLHLRNLIRRSHHQGRKVSETERPPVLDLSLVLADKKGLRQFTTYLQAELSVEAILFWRAVEQYRTASHSLKGTLLPPAQDIFEKYVEEGAPYQVNLPFEIVKQIQDELNSLHSFTVSPTSVPNRPTSEDVSIMPLVPNYTPLALDHSITTLDVSHVEKEPQINGESPSKSEAHLAVELSPPSSSRSTFFPPSPALKGDASSPSSPKSISIEKLRKIFNQAQKEIFDLMRNDPYVRFCKTAEYVEVYQRIAAKHKAKGIQLQHISV